MKRFFQYNFSVIDFMAFLVNLPEKCAACTHIANYFHNNSPDSIGVWTLIQLLDIKPPSIFKLKQSLLLKLLGICHVFLLRLTFENSNQIKLLQIASNCIRLIIWLKQDKIGSNWIKLDQIGSNLIKLE